MPSRQVPRAAQATARRPPTSSRRVTPSRRASLSDASRGDDRSRAAALPPKQWELRAAARMARGADTNGRDIANDIIAAAWDLVGKYEILDFTVKQVAERADVALQTLYRYFGSKDELLLAMLEESMHEAVVFLDAPSEPPVERLKQIVTRPILITYNEHEQRITRWRGRERQRLLETFPDAVEAVYEPYRVLVADAIMAVCEAGDARTDDPDLDASLILHFVQTMAHAVHGGGLNELPEVVAEHVWRMCWAGIGGDPDARPKRRRSRE
jgi:TetR/AcrR family transcriptional regulator